MVNAVEGWKAQLAIFFCGLCLAGVSAYGLRHHQNNLIEKQLSSEVDESFRLIRQNLLWNISTLSSIGSFYLASEFVDTQEFKTFTTPLIKRDPAIDAIAWLTFDENARSIQLEQSILQGTQAFTEFSRRRDDTLFIQPALRAFETGHLQLFSIDHERHGLTDIHEHLDKENDSPIRHLGILYPVFDQSEGVPRIRGFAFIMLDSEFFLKGALPSTEVSSLKYAMNLISQDQNFKLFDNIDANARANKNLKRSLLFSDQTIELSFVPSLTYIASQKSLLPWLLAIGTLIFTTSILIMNNLRRHMNAYRNAKLKAEEANRLKSEFLATISHEIRSPMSGVLGMAELLQETDQTLEQSGYTKTILSCGEALLDIIEDILSFSKIEANKLDLHPVPVNMLELVDDICALYMPKAREKALELVVRYAPGTEQFVNVDPVRLRQILGNLVNNAIKFTEKGSVIVTVEQDNAADVNSPLAHLLFSVADTGIGIPQDAQQRIFERFLQADSSTTRTYGGTGLGLSISKRLTELMGGEIHVESKPGEGSTFSFILPLKRATGHAIIQEKPPILRDLKVLIVDDLAVFRTIVKENLVLSGMRCLCAKSGEDALEIMKKAADIKDPFDIVLIDYLMPSMNGEALARSIKDNAALQGACLVLLSGAGNVIDSEDITEHGFSAFISKQVVNQHLTKALAHIWRKYSAGQTQTLIRIDPQTLGVASHKNSKVVLDDARILIAEDSRINQAFAQEVLEAIGCIVTIASNGQEVLDLLNSGQAFDLIFMDCQMPIMDGFEATSHILKMKKAGKIPENLPIVALTANAMEGDRQKCIEAGMNDYLSKPVRRRDLIESTILWTTGKSHEVLEDEAPARRKPVDQDVRKSEHTPAPVNAQHPALQNSDLFDLLDMQAVEVARKAFKTKYSKMVDYYLEDVETYLSEIEIALEKGDIAQAIRPAHTIKSTSLRMGAKVLADLAQEMELKSKRVQNSQEDFKAQDFEILLQRMAITFDKTALQLGMTAEHKFEATGS